MTLQKAKDIAKVVFTYLKIGRDKCSQNYNGLIASYLALEGMGVTSARKKISEIIPILEGKGRFSEAGELSEKVGQLERALENYRKDDDYKHNERVPEIHERLNQYSEAIRLYTYQRNFLKAGELSEKSENPDDAIKYYREAFCYFNAMEIKFKEQETDLRLIKLFLLQKKKAREAFERNGGQVTEIEEGIGTGKYLINPSFNPFSYW